MLTLGLLILMEIQRLLLTIPFTLNNLIPDSTYNIYVTGLCANNDTSYSSNTISVSTACPYRVAPFTENFDVVSHCAGHKNKLMTILTGIWKLEELRLLIPDLQMTSV